MIFFSKILIMIKSIINNILKILLSLSSIILLILVYFLFNSLVKERYTRDLSEKAVDIIREADVKFSTKEDFLKLKSEIEELLSKGFKIYNSTSVIKDNPKENFFIISKEGIVGFRVYVTDQSIEFKNGRVIGSKGFDVKVPKEIKILDFSNNILAWFKISEFKRLEMLNLRNCRLGSLELSELPYLKEVDFSWNEPLEKIKISGLSNLEKVYINSTLKKIVISDIQAIRNIDFSNYSLEIVDFSNMPYLEVINLKGNRLKEINFYDLPSLREINLSKNKNIKRFEFKNLNKVSTINLSETEIDEKLLGYIASNLPSIKELDISSNFNIKEVDLSNLSYLEKLNIKGNFRLDKLILSRRIKNKVEIEGLNKNRVSLVFK